MATELCGTSFATAYSTTVVHPATSAIHAQVAGVVIPFRTLKSKQAFSMSQGPMWQLAQPYSAIFVNGTVVFDTAMVSSN